MEFIAYGPDAICFSVGSSTNPHQCALLFLIIIFKSRVQIKTQIAALNEITRELFPAIQF